MMNTMDAMEFGYRVAAKLIDTCIIFTCHMALATCLRGHVPEAIQTRLPLDFFLFQMAYNAIFLEKFGATPGKMLLGLQVVTDEDQPIGPLVAFGRSFSELLSIATIYFGYLIAHFDEEGRTLHDRLCHTRVISNW